MNIDRSKHNVLPDNGKWLNSVHKVNGIHRTNNFTVPDDDEDMDSDWLNIGLGRCLVIPQGKTAFQVLSEM